MFMSDPNFKKAACAILSYNHPEITFRAVNSVLKFHPPENIYLIHNGSEQKWIKKHQLDFPQINHLIQTQNKGYTGGVNFAFTNLFENNKNQWVFLLTNDCTLLTNLEAPPTEPGLYSVLIYRRKIDVIDSVIGLFEPKKGKLSHLRSSNFVKLNSSYFYVPGTAFWLDSKTFKDVGLFDESLHTYWEDVDYSMRVQAKNINLNPHLTTQVLHSIGKTCHKNPYYTKFLFQRNRKIISLKYCSSLNEKIYFIIYNLIFSFSKFFIF